MKKKHLLFTLLFSIITLAALPVPLLAQTGGADAWGSVDWAIRPIGQSFGYRDGVPPDIRVIAAVIIRTFLLLLATIFMGLVVYGGFIYMNARGNESEVSRARGILRTGVIGVVIIFCSYAITRFVILAAFCATRDYSQFCAVITRVF